MHMSSLIFFRPLSCPSSLHLDVSSTSVLPLLDLEHPFFFQHLINHQSLNLALNTYPLALHDSNSA